MQPAPRESSIGLKCQILSTSAISSANVATAQHARAARSVGRWRDFIAEASPRFDIPGAWVQAVMNAESGGNTTLNGAPITSPAGAMGLMQLMPGTRVDLRARYGFGRDPYDPHDNIMAGAAYLHELYARYGYPNLFAASSAGPARLEEHLFDGMPLPDETNAYLATLGRPVFEPPRPSFVMSGRSPFFVRHGATGTTSGQHGDAVSSLFVRLSTELSRQP